MNAAIQMLMAQKRYGDLVIRSMEYRRATGVSEVVKFRVELELAVAARELAEITEFARAVGLTVV